MLRHDSSCVPEELPCVVAGVSFCRGGGHFLWRKDSSCVWGQERPETDGAMLGRVSGVPKPSIHSASTITKPAFDLNNKTLVGFQSCLKMCLNVKSWMASYEKLIHLYDAVTNP